MLSTGRVIYAGGLPDAASYFEAGLGTSMPKGGFSSLPEWLVDVTSNTSFDLVTLYAQSETHRRQTAKAEGSVAAALAENTRLERPPSMPGPMQQLSTLLRYRMVTHYKDGEYLGPRIGDKLIFGLLILSLYFGIGDETDTQSIQSTSSLLYFVSALCGYGAAAFVPSLTLDRPLFYRELADGCYTPLVYYLSKFIEEAVLCIFTSLLFSVITFFGCQLQGSFWVFASVYYLTTMCGICLAYAVAAIAPNMEAANALLPTYVTICMYFG